MSDPLPHALGPLLAPAMDRWVERFDAWVEGAPK